MSELVVVTYPDVYRAGEVCATLQRLHEELLIDIEDVAYITREQNGKVKLHETVQVTTTSTLMGLMKGTVWGALIGLIFLNPVLGMVAGGALGAAGGAVHGKLVDYGIPEAFMKELARRCSRARGRIHIVSEGELGKRSRSCSAVRGSSDAQQSYTGGRGQVAGGTYGGRSAEGCLTRRRH